MFFEKAFYFHLNHPDEGFFKYATGHFGLAFGPVGKDNRDFFDLESVLPCQKFHFDLESIACEVNLARADRFKHFLGITLETGCGIFNRDAGNELNIFACAIRH